MNAPRCAAFAFLSVLTSLAAAQTGTPDQVSPYPPNPPVQTANFNGSTNWLIWQQQVRAGISGQLEGFELYMTGNQGATMDARVRVGDAWNTTPILFQTVVVKPTSSYYDVVFVNCSSANIQLAVGATFVIEVQGQNTGAGFNGSYAPPPQTPAYPEELYLDPGQPACFADCHWRMGFTTYMTTGGQTSTYCTAGTTTNSCEASISGMGTPSATAPSGFTIQVDDVEGQKQGLIFYGASGQVAFPWGTSSSWLCVKAPTQRMPIQNSGGTVSTCDGTLSIDWNAFRAANPTALGSPFYSGETFDAQGWFRDPPSPKNTHLSNGLHFTLAP